MTGKARQSRLVNAAELAVEIGGLHVQVSTRPSRRKLEAKREARGEVPGVSRLTRTSSQPEGGLQWFGYSAGALGGGRR
jgi:hypothetical protein